MGPTTGSPDVKTLCHWILNQPGLERAPLPGMPKHCPGVRAVSGDIKHFKVNNLREVKEPFGFTKFYGLHSPANLSLDPLVSNVENHSRASHVVAQHFQVESVHRKGLSVVFVILQFYLTQMVRSVTETLLSVTTLAPLKTSGSFASGVPSFTELSRTWMAKQKSRFKAFKTSKNRRVIAVWNPNHETSKGSSCFYVK